MYVKRMRLYGVKPLRRDFPDGGGALPEPTKQRFLLQGGNGSGKTTILETIRTLWEFFGDWIDRGSGKPPIAKHSRHFLAEAELAAIEMGDCPSAGFSLWIGMGRANAWADLQREHTDAFFAGLIRYGSEPGASRIELPTRDWRTFRLNSMAGSVPQPNILHLPPDNRTFADAPRERAKLIDTTRLNWSAVYDPTLDLDSLLLTVKARDADVFHECLRPVNLALAHRSKEIVGFGEDGRLVVKGKMPGGDAYHHAPAQLSSGERQMLLLIAYTVGFLRPGGILLIDEPDLHIHMSMVTQLLDTLEKAVREKNGQLILASHSEWVWDWFSRDAERIELLPWRGEKQ
jgi:energy-coupling factor transporter ATP-binding protein EcfA2